MKRRILPFPLILAAFACTDSTAPVETPLGARFRIVGEATGSDSTGRSASCRIDLTMEISGPAHSVSNVIEFASTAGGGVERTVLEPDSSGFGFFADVYSPHAVARFGTRDLVALVVGDTVNSEGRFWKELAVLRGARDGNGGAIGIWTCAPFDIWQNGYLDTILVVQGTWRTERF